MENQIVITHYVHPHKFWYKPFRTGIKKKELRQLQEAVDEYCEEHYQLDRKNEPYEPILGEVVTFYDPIQERWVRCNVAGLSGDGKGLRKYRLWSIDEGMPREASTEQLKPLPDHLQDKTTTSVKRGALKNILPVVYVYDPSEEQLCKRECSTWNVSANTMLKSFVDGAQHIRFESVLSCTVGGASIDFGDLLFATKSKTFNAADILSEASHGLIVDSSYFIAQISEFDGFGSSRASSVVEPGGSQGSSRASTKVAQDQAVSTQYEVNESDFDESASMIGTAKRQQHGVALTPPAKIAGQDITSPSKPTPNAKKSLSLAQRLRQKMENTSRSVVQNDTSPTKSSAQGTSSPIPAAPSDRETPPRATKQQVPSAAEAVKVPSSENMLEHCITIDVGFPEQVELELMEAKQPEPERQKPVDPPSAEKASPKPGAGGLKSMLMQRIARAKAASTEQSVDPAPKPEEKQPTPSPPKPPASPTAPTAMRFVPAGVALDILSAAGPTVQSNAELKRFETLIQEEKW
uniref:RNA helicase n=1 Tax=Anopheles dirus TaxID=7168 RepID=A0A182MY53_9DIPT